MVTEVWCPAITWHKCLSGKSTFAGWVTLSNQEVANVVQASSRTSIISAHECWSDNCYYPRFKLGIISGGDFAISYFHMLRLKYWLAGLFWGKLKQKYIFSCNTALTQYIISCCPFCCSLKLVCQIHIFIFSTMAPYFDSSLAIHWL